MSREIKLALLALGLIALTPAAWAQSPVYKGGVSTTANPLDPTNFPNEDPLQVEPRQLPTVVQGNQPPVCKPPDKTWQPLAQDGNNCLYAAPLSPAKKQLYSGATVVPKNQIYQINAQGGRCGADPWNDSKAVCNPGPSQTANGGASAPGYGSGLTPAYGGPVYNPTPTYGGGVSASGAPDCSVGAPGAYSPSYNPACQPPHAPLKGSATRNVTGTGSSSYPYSYPDPVTVPQAAPVLYGSVCYYGSLLTIRLENAPLGIQVNGIFQSFTRYRYYSGTLQRSGTFVIQTLRTASGAKGIPVCIPVRVSPRAGGKRPPC
jgi:hypothetical protein